MESENEWIKCPYNKSHLVDPLRMPYHLMKCRKTFPDVRFAVCPYSALHEVPQVELQHHMANCPDKRLVEGVDPPHALLYSLTGREPNMLKGCTDIPPPANIQFDDDGEQWDVNIERNQGPVSPSSQVIHGRCNIRHNDETDNLRPSRNFIPVDFQVRRPITHSVAERLRPRLSSESPEDVSASENSDICENSDSGSDSMAGKRLFGQKDKFSTKNLGMSTTSDVTVSANLSSRLSGCMNIKSDKIEENKVLATAKDKYIMRGRGRASLLDILPNRPRSERKPGPVLSLSSFPVVGRGRSLSTVPSTDS